MRKHWMADMLRTALRILGFQLVLGFFGLFLTPALMDLGSAIRVPLILVLIGAAGYLMFMDGASRGQREYAAAETLGKLSRKGAYTPSDAENAKRFSRPKAVLASLAGVLPVLLMAAYVAATTQPYAYSLQGAPAWLSAYTNRPEIGAPLAYLQNAQPVANLTDYLRIAVRFALFLYVGLFGALSDAASLLFDRVSPLLSLVMPAVAAIGYQFGPLFHGRYVKAIEEAKRRPRKRLKKNVRKRTVPEEKKRLI